MKSIGKYAVLRELGAGGFGAVYLCDDPLLQEQVAVKVFQVRDANAAQQATSASGDASRILRERFLAEARVLRRLSANPHIVEVYDFAETVDGTPYYVMPYLSQTLVDEIGKDAMDPAVIADLPAELRPRKLPINRASIILDQVLDALSAVHKAGLIHRDIKPANILFNADGVVQLCDFGIAKLPDTDHSQTSSGMAMGSRNYMAPEQRESAKHVDARADVYAFGVLAYRVYTGAMPVGRFDDPIALSPALGKDLNELILSCLDQSKERRPADASVLRVRFKAALSAASGVPAAGAEDHSGTWVEAGRGEASYKASVSPLESRVEALLGEHGEIPQDAWHELNALAAIGSVSEGALQSLVEQVASRLGTPLEAKRNFLKHVDSLAARGTDLSAQRPALLAAAQAVGWDAAKVDAVIAARAPTQPAPTRAPTPSAGAVSPPPTHTIHPRARPSAPRATNKRSSARWVMAGLVLGVVGLAGALLGPPLSTRWAERADGADPAQAQSTPSAPASQLAAAPAPQRPPAGSDARPAPASTAAAPSQDRPAATPAETPEQRITALSRRLDTQVAGFKLTRPAGDNAAETLEQIKAINPDHPKVGEGTRAIAGKYLELFERDLAANDLPKAASYIALAEGFTPGSQAIEQAKTKMKQAEADLANWNVVDRSNVDSLHGYLGRYPQGRHAAEAQQLLATLASPEPAVVPVVPSVVPPAAQPTADPDRSSGPRYRAADEERSYLNAFELLKTGDYGGAIRGFEIQLQRFPNGRLADQAAYWTGESYYVQSNYAAAAGSFQRVINSHPDSPRAPDALFKLALAQQEMKQTRESQASLREVIDRYPSSSAARLARQRLEGR